MAHEPGRVSQEGPGAADDDGHQYAKEDIRVNP
jgi:hypothetical protein